MRTNSRARTLNTIPVRDNRVFEILTLRDGYGVGRSTHYYRRRYGNGLAYTGPAPIGSVHGSVHSYR